MPDETTVVKPIYQQIALDIAGRIVKNEFELGERIYGRSKLAGEYNVSPETIRRAMTLLEDMDIVDVNQGSGIVIKSRESAYKFIDKFVAIKSINSLKNDIQNLLNQKKQIEENLENAINELVDSSQRFRNSNLYVPVEIDIDENSSLINKTISEVQFWQNTGATIIGIKRNKKIILSPGPYATFKPGDVFLVIGDENVYDRVMNFIHE